METGNLPLHPGVQSWPWWLQAGCSCQGGTTSTKTHHETQGFKALRTEKMNLPSPGDAQCLLQVTQTLMFHDCRERNLNKKREENPEKQPN